MANSHVEIHDPIANGDASPDAEAPSPNGGVDDTVEMRLLMVYSQRRRPAEAPAVDGVGRREPPPPQGEEDEEAKKRRKKKKKRGGVFRMCLRPRTKSVDLSEPASNGPDPEFRCGGFVAAVSRDDVGRSELDEAAGKLMEMADGIPFAPPDIEPDCPQDDVEKVVALLLRDAGDKLDEETKGCNIAAELFGNYSFFEKVVKTLLSRMGLVSSDPEHLGPKASPKVQIAVTCEATYRMLTLTSAPPRSMLLYGARYLREYFSPWVTQNGGYEEVFHSEDEGDVE